MINVRSASAWVLTAGVLLAIGCEHTDSSVQPVAGTAPPPGVTNRQNAATERVVESVSYARCDHEQACNNVGDGKRYATRNVCMDQIRGDTANQLNAYNCPHGIDQQALDKCLSSLRAPGNCGFSLSNMLGQSDCRDSALCLK